MAADGTSKEPTDPVESLIDDAIREILEEAGSSRAAARGRSAPNMLDVVMSAMPARGAARAPMLERLLIAEAMAGALADALAPALAAALAPRIMKLLDQDGDTVAEPKVTSGRSRKSDGK
ncbi:hypothetical protein GCM10010399_77340 [Dactylosporangium fulvum]|uniref:Uncharacterized protein n=1 Tax=Dactylosporangium fulvum TaxID=53359 RepID=A0ABY5W6W4_9ACTN|nr:hypothetical protein [Dactylosporangium fulvum]UWP85071.1 hypothetical protein Dfulv_12915 [Dactylosporangium fulvum]